MTEPKYTLSQIRDSLFASVLSDCLDQVGYRNQALPPHIRPLDDKLVLAGRARTAGFREVKEVTEGQNPYALEIALIDSLQPGDVPVFSCVNTQVITPWGELLTTAAQARGAGGALMDGCVRDIKPIREMGFPVFSGGIATLDTKGRGVIDNLDHPVECAGVSVQAGDLIFGDADGVVVIPHEVEDQVLNLAFKKVAEESHFLEDLKKGDSLGTVYDRYGIL